MADLPQVIGPLPHAEEQERGQEGRLGPVRVLSMARSIATTSTVDLAGLLDFVRPRNRLLLATARRDGRPQISPVTGGLDSQGRIAISTYPTRSKTRNAVNNPRVSVLILSDDWNGPWVQVDEIGRAHV